MAAAYEKIRPGLKRSSVSSTNTYRSDPHDEFTKDDCYQNLDTQSKRLICSSSNNHHMLYSSFSRTTIYNKSRALPTPRKRSADNFTAPTANKKPIVTNPPGGFPQPRSSWEFLQENRDCCINCSSTKDYFTHLNGRRHKSTIRLNRKYSAKKACCDFLKEIFQEEDHVFRHHGDGSALPTVEDILQNADDATNQSSSQNKDISHFYVSHFLGEPAGGSNKPSELLTPDNQVVVHQYSSMIPQCSGQPAPLFLNTTPTTKMPHLLPGYHHTSDHQNTSVPGNRQVSTTTPNNSNSSLLSILPNGVTPNKLQTTMDSIIQNDHDADAAIKLCAVLTQSIVCYKQRSISS